MRIADPDALACIGRAGAHAPDAAHVSAPAGAPACRPYANTHLAPCTRRHARAGTLAVLLAFGLTLGGCDERNGEARAGEMPASAAAATPQARATTRDWSRAPGIPIALDHVDRDGAAFARFRRWVDAAASGQPGYAFAARDAALLYRLEPKPKYCALAVKLVEAEVTAAEAAIADGRAPEIAGDSYLEVGPRIADVAMTLDTCGDTLTPEQRRRWSDFAEQAVWNVWNPLRAHWGLRPRPWTGWSVDNPGNNYYYSFVEATLYWALASGSADWMRTLGEDKMPALQAYYAKLPGGGSREGTGYGTAHMRLFSIYRLWRAATGEDIAGASPHARDSIAYWVHATVPTLDRFAPIGDQSRNSVPELYDYHRRLMLEARSLTDDAAAQAMADAWLAGISVQRMEHGFNTVHDLMAGGETRARGKGRHGENGVPGSGDTEGRALFHHAAGAGHLFARSGWDRDAMWLAVVAGPYTESHAHQDQGGFTLFGGDWLAVTANIWSRSGIVQTGLAHNVLRFERDSGLGRPCRRGDDLGHPRYLVPQCEPSTSTMRTEPLADGGLRIDADLTGAYGGNAAVRAWTRRLDFAARRLRIEDRYAVAPGTEAVFQLQLPEAPRIEGPGARAGRLQIRVLEPAGARLEAVEWRSLKPDEFQRGWRLDVRAPQGGTGSGTYIVELSEAP